jgi:hypothetical protein
VAPTQMREAKTKDRAIILCIGILQQKYLHVI